MDRIRNPYTPGAGRPPPELAGRDELREDARVAMERIRAGKHAKSALLVGLRGVGKTVLLTRMQRDAEQAGLQTMAIEAPEDRSLPAMLVPELRRALIALSANEKARELASRALAALAGFVSAIRVSYQDVHLGLNVLDPLPGVADAGDLEHDLRDLFRLVGEAAAEAQTAAVLFIDELQYVEEAELAALITALHHTSQRELPVVLFGAGLPQLPGKLGKAKSYAERLFDLAEIGPLEPGDAERAIVEPAREEGVEYDPEAIGRVLEITQGYAYFLQVWGKYCWEVAVESPISAGNVAVATSLAVADLDSSFFWVRFDRLTPSEKRYLRAMAELGEGPHRSGEIADEIGKKVQSVAPVRSRLINKGMIWSPSHGDIAFSVPLFDEYMKRIMPDADWREI